MFQALNATSETLRQHLSAQIQADASLSGAGHPWTARGMKVTLNTPADVSE
jgi:hypothetical protein